MSVCMCVWVCMDVGVWVGVYWEVEGGGMRLLMSVGFFLSPAAGATAPREVHLGQAAIWIDKEKEETGKSGDGHGQSFLHLFTTLPLPYPCAKTRWGESSSCTFTSVPDPLPHAPSLSPPPSTNKNAGTVYPQRLASF